MAHTEKCRGCMDENRCDFIHCTKETEKNLWNRARRKGIEEFAEEMRKAYASMKNIPEVERATANTIILGVEKKLKGE